YAVLMPAADRNLDTIFRSERPDINAIRHLVQTIASAVGHLHSKNLIHGDLKLLNVVRIMDRLCLIDLDASSPVGDEDMQFFAGAKFSSGVAPPEMIHKLKNKAERDQFASYFSSAVASDPELWTKIKPKEKKKGRLTAHYVVKTFRAITDGDGNEQPLEPHLLPYSPVESAPAFDMWSLGTVLFTLVTGSPLFPVNRDDDLNDGEAMEALVSWDEKKHLPKLLSSIENPPVKDLLMKIKAIAGGVKRIEANTEALMKGQAQIIKMGAATQQLVKKSTSTVSG
ncbi:hypothetical protein TeGR_g6503, partial [Tetraparma gracilis]